MISKSLENAQKKVEGFHFDQRKHVVQYDDVMNRHRKAVYAMRKEILRSGDIKKRIKIFIEEEAKTLTDSPDLMSEQFETFVRDVFPLDEPAMDRLFDTSADKFGSALMAQANEMYDARESAFTKEIMRKVERDIYLQILDNLWMQHLENMDHLREGIHWMSVGQRDPLVEYRRQSQLLFDEMQLVLRRDVVRTIFHAQPVSFDELDRPAETELTRAARQSISNADRIMREGGEFEEDDFSAARTAAAATAAAKKQTDVRKKARKAERKRKSQGRKRK
jgi:preprotein translocase subunit SecA